MRDWSVCQQPARSRLLAALFPGRPAIPKKFPRAFVWLALAVTTACGPGTRAADRDPVLRIGFGVSATALPSGVAVLTNMLYSESLFRKEWDGQLRPHLAERWEWSEEGHTLRLTLKPGVTLHDGSILTGEMVARQLTALMEQEEDGLESVTSITAPDDRSIVLEVSKPDFFLLAALAEIRILHPDNPDIATGPFALVQRAPTVETRRFDRYHGGSPDLGGVRITTYETQRAAWVAMLRDEVDVVQEINRDSAEFTVGSSQIETYSSVQPFYIPLVFNLNHPVLRNVEVRRALSEAIDREEIVGRVFRDRARIATDPIWPMHWAQTQGNTPPLYDPESAKARLDRAGYPNRPSPVQPDRRRRFQLRCLVYEENSQFERIAMLLEKQLSEVGVDLVIELTPIRKLGERAAGGDFETFLLPANASRTLERTYRYWRSASPENPGPSQASGYTGADGYFDRLRRSTTEAQIRDAVAGLARQFATDVPAAFIAWPEVTRAINRRFSTDELNGRDPFFDLWRWRPSTLTQ